MPRKHDQYTIARATNLYFEIEKHFALGGTAPTLRQINKMVGRSSSASSQMYVKILEEWGLITRVPKTCRTIILAKRNYPPVDYRSDEKRTEGKCVTFNEKT